MANYTLGQLGLNPRGAYNASTAYTRLDVVTYGGNNYVALAAATGVVPTNIGMLLAQGESDEPEWNYVTLSSGTTPGNYGAGRMRYMKMGNHVFVAGSVNVIYFAPILGVCRESGRDAFMRLRSVWRRLRIFAFPEARAPEWVFPSRLRRFR